MGCMLDACWEDDGDFQNVEAVENFEDCENVADVQHAADIC